MELLKHVARHHINETNEANDLKDQGEEIFILKRADALKTENIANNTLNI